MKGGARETRSGRAAYGGKRSADPTLTSKVLIAINAAVWMLVTATGAAASPWIERLALLPLGQCSERGGFYPSVRSAEVCAQIGSATWYPGVADGAVWQLFTSMFTHVDLMHIGFNMLALWILGPQLEMLLGRLRFLAVYLLSGLGGSMLVYLLAAPGSATLGASGAIFGLMGALLIAALKVRGNVQGLMLWIGLNAVITVLGRNFISWQGHLGGFLAGLALMALLVFSPRERRGMWQALGIAAYAVLLVAVLATRTAVLA